jgi:tRNA pseudouridine55 synthase
MRRIAGTKKIGHLGTLDPAATGVLPLVIGRATRLAQFYTRNEKVYEGVIFFGQTTDSYDAEGEPTSPLVDVTLERDGLDRLLDQFRGDLMQVPPAVSAKKIAGRPAYELARKGEVVELKPVAVTIHSIEILWVEGPRAAVRIHCSGGTYVRSIAHDVGQAMGCGAHLETLRREVSGSFTLADARTLEQLAELSAEGRLSEALIPAAKLLPDFPSEMVDQITAGQIRHGRDFRSSPFRPPSESRYIKAVTPEGELVAIGEAVLPNLYHPVLVF